MATVKLISTSSNLEICRANLYPVCHARAASLLPRHHIVLHAYGKDQDPDAKFGIDKSKGPKSKKGEAFERTDRRRGRPAYLRSPEDSPLRDANRDFVLGVLTARAARTLVVYLQETNLTVSQWLVSFMNKNPITLSGTWEDIAGDTFLRKLLSMPIEEAKWNNGVDQMHDNFAPIGVDPRSIAQRILEIRAQLATEVIEDLGMVPEDNNEILRQSLRASLEKCMQMEPVTVKPGASADGSSDTDDVCSV